MDSKATDKSPRRRFSFRAIILFASIWIFALVFGLIKVASYSAKSGEVAEASTSWPNGSNLSMAKSKFSLQIFVHPECPCSKATLGEIETLLPRFGNRVNTTVIFVAADGFRGNVQGTSLWRQANDLPGVKVVQDLRGQESKIFGARTSGQAFLYSPAGALIFSGGITPSRGHMGDSLGKLQLLTALSDPSKIRLGGKVFGCSLHSNDRHAGDAQ